MIKLLIYTSLLLPFQHFVARHAPLRQIHAMVACLQQYASAVLLMHVEGMYCRIDVLTVYVYAEFRQNVQQEPR